VAHPHEPILFHSGRFTRTKRFSLIVHRSKSHTAVVRLEAKCEPPDSECRMQHGGGSPYESPVFPDFLLSNFQMATSGVVKLEYRF